MFKARAIPYGGSAYTNTGVMTMRLQQIAERRISATAGGTSLRPLSAQEIRQVAGAIYYGDGIIIGGHDPVPGPDPSPYPYPVLDTSVV
jgi:hypothetical protein